MTDQRNPFDLTDDQADRSEKTDPHIKIMLEKPLERQSTRIKKELKKEIGHKTNIKLGAAVVGTVATSIASVLVFIDNRVAAQTDAGVRVHEGRLVAVEQGLVSVRAETNNRLDRAEQQGNRMETKVDALLEKFRVPNPAPSPKDGGT